MPHWRDHLNSPLLGAYSLFDDETEGWKEVDGTIIRCCKEEHILGASGKQMILVAYTSLSNRKPMKINVTISKVIQRIAKSMNPDKWVNIPVTFYVDTNVKSKLGTSEAIRVKPRVQRQQADYSKQNASLRACTTLDELKVAYSALNGIEQGATVAVKDEMKVKLTPKK